MSEYDTSALSLQVLGLFRIIFKSSNKHFEAIEKAVGVSGAQLWTLSEIAQADGIKVSHLARVMSLHQSTVSNLIVKLEERQLVDRVRDEKDRRSVRLKATSTGLAVLGRAPAPLRGLLPDALMRMQPEQLAALKTALDTVLDLMEIKTERYAREPLGEPITLDKS